MHRFVQAPRAAASTGLASSGALPADLLAIATRRLLLTGYVMGGAYAFYFLLYKTVWSDYGTTWGQVAAIVSLVASLALVVYLRRGSPTQRRVANLAIGYELVICAMIGLSEYCALPPLDAPVGMISWMCVVIIWFPLVVLSTPRRVLIASVAAATMSPLGLAAGVLFAGIDLPPADVTASFLIPPYLCAAIAYAPARVLHRLRTEVSKARQLGSYELVDRLGQGGMGEIWRARHKFLVRPAAVKVSRPEMIGADDSDAVARAAERFEREAQVTATLESPHTVELFDFGVADDGTFYYVMELLDGVDLDRMVRDHGPLPARRVVHLLRQACDSLDDAHGHGLVHRDIKPANLVVVPRRGRRRDFLKILDFGLVKGDPRGDDAPLTTTGVSEVKGTPAFLAPEMVTGKGTVDGRADLYALACVGCWMLTGGYLFDADSAMAMAIAHATEPPVAPSRRGVAVPAEVEALLLRCLAKDPADRPATAGELADLLAALPLEPWTEADADAWWRDRSGAPTADAAAAVTPAAGQTRVA